MVDLSVNFAGLELENPVFVAALTPMTRWNPSKMVKGFKKYTDEGASAVLTHCVCPTPEAPEKREWRGRFLRQKSEKPFGYEGFYLITPHQDTVGYKNRILKLVELAKEELDVPIGVNLSGSGADTDSWAELARDFEERGVDFLELNVSCPDLAADFEVVESFLSGELPTNAGFLLGQLPEKAGAVTKEVKDNVDIPVIAKMTPENGFPTLLSVAKSIKEAGADGITAINTPVTVAPPDIYNPQSGPFSFVDNNTITGAYGPWDRFLAYKFIASISKFVPNIDVSGVGGNVDPKHSMEFIALGAKTVQLSSGLIWRGRGIIRQTISFMKSFLENQGYDTIDEFRGVSQSNIKTIDEVEFQPAVAEVDYEKCTRCGQCGRLGTLEYAIEINDTGEPIVDQERCTGCGLCTVICPEDAIKLVPTPKR